MNPLSIIILVFFIVFIIMVLRYIYSDFTVLQGIQNGETSSTIPASSLTDNGTGVPASNFAYSIWFYVNDWNYRYGEPKVIFGRMGALSDASSGDLSGISGADPCPAVILGAVENNIMVALGCYPGADQQPTNPKGKTVVHTCSISNVPIQKWVNLIISVYGRTMDLYIDGKLVKTCLLPGVANINNNASVIVTPKGGFDGWTSNFQYFPNPLNPQQCWNIYTAGPGTGGLSSYQLKLSVVENGTTQSSVTI
jgi:hypothetical protein